MQRQFPIIPMQDIDTWNSGQFGTKYNLKETQCSTKLIHLLGLWKLAMGHKIDRRYTDSTYSINIIFDK